jgi:uncharacterized membrane protein (DUF4010 family)
MYLRLLVIIAVFNRSLALAIAPPLLVLSALGTLAAAGWYWLGRARRQEQGVMAAGANPLEVGAAVAFAALFIATSVASSWAVGQFGTAGVYALAVIVGVADIDPFVLSLAQHGAGQISNHADVIAILLATSSNNVLKATYVVAYSGGRRLIGPVAALLLLAACGVVLAFV